MTITLPRWERARSAKANIVRRLSDAAAKKRLARLREELVACLEAPGGEVSARARIATLANTYLELDAAGREHFFRLLGEFSVDRVAVSGAIDEFSSHAGGDAEYLGRVRRLRAALVSPWVRLLTEFNSVAGGVKFLVDLRADLLQVVECDGKFQALECDLRDVLASWFDIGFLELRRITWDAPAAYLEKLAGYEAVHEVRNWQDLKNRLETDRRCFAFHHPAMPSEPLIFVEVALTTELTGQIKTLLRRNSAISAGGGPTTAIFYSISNCQVGLEGISFGNALIKRVVNLLSKEFPRLRTFATLSPIPGLIPWLRRYLSARDQQPGEPAGGEGILSLLSAPSWYRDAAAAAALRGPLMRLCTHYLLREKRNSPAALDPVEHFHLSNGARLERINWLADTSRKGLRESAGMMANYLYTIEQIDDNHEAYVTSGRIACAAPVRELLR